ncbi:NAD(P)H dehydrogenase [Noviherbaspirillum cavernae]|uniref:NAD(P)H dehydrogenase n=1 Tax=Noviherbaspirillum cavernae TaxID=2320862 RepID=A0A418X190_9BURK|nr:NAD(P)H-dependent oxidoreductase [Noviherbaspirillum cavernae]RJG06206.1 NAD(P)H dehydrogenase [Noviherbaspirillum cavernae]
MTTAPRILVVYAHPMHNHSRVNRRLSDAARSVPNVRVHDLYESYPDFHIDIEHEQALLRDADLIVFQYPVQWYSMPSLLKEWIDVVLEEGWAYGNDGTALQGKDFRLVATAGGDIGSYQASGYHGYPFSAFLPSFQQMATLCGMRWLTPFVLYGARDVNDDTVEAHAETYRQYLASYPESTAVNDANGSAAVGN